MAGLDVRDRSVYHKAEHGSFVDQVYATSHFEGLKEFESRVAFEPGVRTPRSSPLGPLELVIHQAFVEVPITSSLRLTVGKKTEYRGSGIFVNPSDLLNEEKDVFEALYQAEGKIFSRIAWIGERGSLGAGYIPSRSNGFEVGKLWPRHLDREMGGVQDPGQDGGRRPGCSSRQHGQDLEGGPRASDPTRLGLQGDRPDPPGR